jgi:type IVB pilus formation R64 PilN family outer membrane protein
LAAAGDGQPTAKQSAEPARTIQPVTDLNSIEMSWQNRDMVTILNGVTDRLGLAWSYRDGVVTIHRFVTESFELAAFASAQDFDMRLNGASQGASGSGGGASGSSSSNLMVSEKGKSDAVQSIVATVTKMLSNAPGSTVTLSEGTARLTVTTTKDAMREVRTVLRTEQESMTRQVLLQVDIYSLTNSTSNESGFNLNVFFQNLQNTMGASFIAPTSTASTQAGGLVLNILSLANGGNPNSETVRRFGDSNLILQALLQKGVSVQHQPLTMIALNRQWARKTNLRSTGYLSETTPSTVSGAGSGAPGLKTSTITTGDRFLIQPAVLDNGSVMLKFGVSLTNLLGLFDVTAGSGATFQRVQTPEVSGTDDQATVLLRAGEVMVLTGMARHRSSNDGRSLGEGLPRMLGGSVKASDTREEFIIFVRPVIL